ncbi:hypothetical protein [Flavobacterium sp.]|uniref:hypothetical protein n=1 Tax=Flavobacterium sp. TaxID=239 RepID=UPI002FDE06E4
MVLEKNHTEGATAKAIEKQTSKLPSDLFLYASLAAMGTSLTLKLMGEKDKALFVGQWAAPFLLLGIYNKLVKLEGHDAHDKNLDNGDMSDEDDDDNDDFNSRNQYSGSGDLNLGKK